MDFFVLAHRFQNFDAVALIREGGELRHQTFDTLETALEIFSIHLNELQGKQIETRLQKSLLKQLRKLKPVILQIADIKTLAAWQEGSFEVYKIKTQLLQDCNTIMKMKHGFIDRFVAIDVLREIMEVPVITNRTPYNAKSIVHSSHHINS